MFVFRHGGRAASRTLRASTPQTYRRAASRIAIPLPSAPSPVPIIEQCPSPTCGCRATPPDLDIERETNLNGSMASYGEQILLCTGKADWKSKIEDEEDAGLLRQLKKFLVRGGKYVDVRGLSEMSSIEADRSSVAISQCLDHKQLVCNETKPTAWQRSRYYKHVVICFSTP